MTSPRLTESPHSHVAPIIVAHRGASAHAPENTLAAFRRAIEVGAEGIEFDVRLAKDGVAVVHHDSSLRRTAGIESKISEFTATDLSTIDVGSWFRSEIGSPDFSKQTVPTFAETLDTVKDFRGRVYVELKVGSAQDPEPLLRAVCGLIRESPIANQIVVKSFRLSVIPYLRNNCPNVRTAALFAPKIMTILRKEKYLVDLAVEFGAHELSVHYSLATKKLMKKAAKHSLPVTIWTVNHPRWLRRAIKLGVHAVITNDPARMIEVRQALYQTSTLRI